MKNICLRLLLKIRTSVTNLPKGGKFLNFVILVAVAEYLFYLSNIFLWIKKSSKQTHQVRCCHFFIFEIINESRIWYRCQNTIENYHHHDQEQLGFYKKKYISKHRAKEGCSRNLYIARNEWVSIYLTKTVLKETSNCILNMEKVDLMES